MPASRLLRTSPIAPGLRKWIPLESEVRVLNTIPLVAELFLTLYW